MKRRQGVAIAVAAVAAAAGVGGALWRSRPRDAAAGADIWPLEFEAPRGGRVALASLRGKPLLLNFWATWCAPCVGEMPVLDRFASEQRARGWQVLGLAVDSRDPVLAFLERTPVGYPVGLAGMGGVELSRRLGNSAGALPFSVVFDREGRPVEHKLGVIEAVDLQRWVASFS